MAIEERATSVALSLVGNSNRGGSTRGGKPGVDVYYG